MKEQISLKKNFIMNSLLTLSSILFPLITYPYVSRILGPEGTGKVTFATSAVTIFSMFAQLGIPTYGIRECARVRDDRHSLSKSAEELLLLNLVTSLAAFVALIVCTLVIPQLSARRSLMFLMSSIIFFNMLGMEWLFQGLEQYTYITARSLVFKLIGLIGVFLLVRGPEDVLPYAAVTVFSGYASQLLNFFYAHRFLDRIPLRELSPFRHLRPVLVFFAMACATTLYTNLDNIMLGFMAGDIEVGYYNAGVRVKHILVSIVTSLGTVLLPRASYYVENGEMDKFTQISRKALRFIFFTALPLSIFFMINAGDCVLVLFGPSFSAAVSTMRIILPTVFFIGLTNIIGIQMLIPLGHEKSVFWSVAAGAITDLVLNAILIPYFQSAGAAVGTLAAEFVVLFFQLHALRKILPEFLSAMKFQDLRPYLTGTILGAFLCIIPILLLAGTGLFHELLRLCFSLLIFASVYLGWLLLHHEELCCETILSAKSFLRRMSKRQDRT